ncbi:hypothetical protein PAXRUDRAFT_833211 [Paxillus rubicundulus Ve08.2h10]|uniref:Uncharacterized protein n=1 Tax=Paxillus rubicundulus Ve08.2h10 TaxID=930991 RepID=A0A0D0CE82_9AGAM|nr:hypothetical protein PAXRUDRAFT_833211 [Paxillus rubicundulus Ve08.2h10]
MSVSTSVLPILQPRVRRKPAPSLELDARYPNPDPDDPFVPLSVLRSRTASTLSSVGAPLSFQGNSTSHLPTLPYTGGRYLPDIYQAYLDSLPATAPVSSGKKQDVVTSPFARSTTNIDTEQSYEQGSDMPRWPSQDSVYRWEDNPRHFPLQRRRSRSAVSRKEARFTASISPRNSPYGHSNLQSYVLASALSSTPAFTAEPLPMSPTSSIRHGSESVHSLGPYVNSDVVPSSPLRLASFSAEVPVVASSKVKKFSRLLPKRSGGRQGLAHQSTDTLALSPTNTSFTSFPFPNERSSTTRHVSEENTFHARRKSTALFPADIVANLHTMDVSSPLRNSTAGYVYDPLTDAELGYMSDPGSSISHSQASVSSPTSPAARTATHVRSHTITNGLTCDLVASSRTGCEIARPSTTSFPAFDEHALPTPRQLMDVASCLVIAENGLRVPFGELFRDQKTIVIFVRHFWCPLCQDYMFSVASNIDLKLLKQANVNLIVIGNGSYNMIKSYKQIFRAPFAFYTDPSLRLHAALGMTLRVLEPKSQRKRGGYVRHGHMGGIAMVFKNALRVGMPVWEKGGDPAQLGGEFILGPGLTASYAHRMPNARSHAPIMHVLAAAGMGVQCEMPMPAADTVGRTSVPPIDEEKWMEERRLSLARIRERKLARRMGVAFPSCDEHQVILPKVELPGPLCRSDSIEEEKEEDAENVQQLDSPVQTKSTTCRVGENIGGLNSTSDDGDTETASVGSRTMTESDSGSDRTKTEEVGPHLLQDKMAVFVDLDDPSTTLQVVSL